MNYCGIDVLRKVAISTAILLTGCTGNEAPVEPAAPGFPVTQDFLKDHPSKIFMEAANYLENGDMEAATLWFYAGQLRYRVLLDCPVLKPSPQDLIVFSAQFEIMEPRVNGWAADNLAPFVEILDRVLAWDERNTNTPANYANCVEARNKVRGTYETIRQTALSQ